MKRVSCSDEFCHGGAEGVRSMFSAIVRREGNALQPKNGPVPGLRGSVPYLPSLGGGDILAMDEVTPMLSFAEDRRKDPHWG